MRLNPASLRQIRTDHGWSISTLSAKSTVARSHISNIENGNRPASPDVIRKLAEALEVNPYALLGPEDPKTALKELVALMGFGPADLFPAAS